MLFNSHVFLFVFLPLVLWIWWHNRLSLQQRLMFLTAASYLFYGWWDYRFVGLLLVSTSIDYGIGLKIAGAKSETRGRLWLLVSMASNLGLLAFFKYSGFFASSWNSVLEWLRVGGEMPVPDIILPAGISFYTFQTMSYAIDIYRKEAKPTDSFWHFAAYVSLFPQLIAGPIVRYQALEDQLRRIAVEIDWPKFSQGIVFFVIGLAQKILLADLIASKINPMLADYQGLQLAGAWFAMLGYSCQLYFDFCGYSNMAVGLGLMLGFQFPQNFNSPYVAKNIADFWRRWHMTLSSWLRDYLFIPLGGSRRGHWLTLRNLVIVMFLGGLWHGAGWTFVLWGLYHGALLAAHSLYRRAQESAQSAQLGRWLPTLPAPLSIMVTFFAVVIGWTLFRATDLGMFQSLLASMFGLRGVEVDVMAGMGGLASIGLLAGLMAVVFFVPNSWTWRLKPSVPLALLAAVVFVICVLRLDGESPFLYFQF